MLRLVLEGANLSLWPIISLVIFFGTSLGVLLWIYRPGSSEFYRQLGGLALEDQARGASAKADTRSTATITPQIPSEN
jgi:cbb3-type cytochrome oxidase subunit 3